ncbi:MAG: polysaccharide lyase [Myxococcales bacterium]
MYKLSLAIVASAALLAGASRAAIPAYPDNPDVLWRGDFEGGASSLTGACSYETSGWCNKQSVRPEQIQVVTDPDPIFEGHNAVRFEVKYGDQYRTYSDERSLLSPPLTLWEDEGNDRWYRWQVLWPQDWVGSYPKWDELGTPSSRNNAGSIVEWHHDANGGVESGSAPLYFRGEDKYITMCLVDQRTSACRETINLAELQRGHWHDFVMHAKWSSDPKIGFLEIWIDGVNVLPKHMASNKYPGMRNYLLIGLYRNAHIGDPNLLYPDGTHVYGTDGTPGVAYVDGFVVGRTQESVMPPVPEPVATTPAPTPTPSTPADGSPATTPDPTTSAPASTPAPTTTAPASTPEPAGTPVTAKAGIGFPQGGCSSGGFQSIWLALPLLGLFALRRRRLAA